MIMKKLLEELQGGDFGFRLNKSIALGMVKPEACDNRSKIKN